MTGERLQVEVDSSAALHLQQWRVVVLDRGHTLRLHNIHVHTRLYLYDDCGTHMYTGIYIVHV